MNYSHGSLENHIMNVIWAIEEDSTDDNISVNTVLQKMNNSGSVRAYTTVKTVMDRLVSKGFLVRYKVGKKFCYKSTSSRIQLGKLAIEKLASQYFRNDIKAIEQTIKSEFASSSKK